MDTNSCTSGSCGHPPSHPHTHTHTHSGPGLPGEVCHLHHDHAHLLGQHDDVIATVVPLGHLGIQLALLLLEAGHLFGDLCLLLHGKLGHDSLEGWMEGQAKWVRWSPMEQSNVRAIFATPAYFLIIASSYQGWRVVCYQRDGRWCQRLWCQR